MPFSNLSTKPKEPTPDEGLWCYYGLVNLQIIEVLYFLGIADRWNMNRWIAINRKYSEMVAMAAYSNALDMKHAKQAIWTVANVQSEICDALIHEHRSVRQELTGVIAGHNIANPRHLLKRLVSASAMIQFMGSLGKPIKQEGYSEEYNSVWVSHNNTRYRYVIERLESFIKSSRTAIERWGDAKNESINKCKWSSIATNFSTALNNFYSEIRVNPGSSGLETMITDNNIYKVIEDDRAFSEIFVGTNKIITRETMQKDYEYYLKYYDL